MNRVLEHLQLSYSHIDSYETSVQMDHRKINNIPTARTSAFASPLYKKCHPRSSFDDVGDAHTPR